MKIVVAILLCIVALSEGKRLQKRSVADPGPLWGDIGNGILSCAMNAALNEETFDNVITDLATAVGANYDISEDCHSAVFERYDVNEDGFIELWELVDVFRKDADAIIEDCNN